MRPNTTADAQIASKRLPETFRCRHRDDPRAIAMMIEINATVLFAF
jgi:hypothetical protein